MLHCPGQQINERRRRRVDPERGKRAAPDWHAGVLVLDQRLSALGGIARRQSEGGLPGDTAHLLVFVTDQHFEVGQQLRRRVRRQKLSRQAAHTGVGSVQSGRRHDASRILSQLIWVERVCNQQKERRFARVTVRAAGNGGRYLC